ncbi:MAG: MBL fold metallo-hydrolase [Odoribacteraceae bacterium]|jgi:glyoxylase-like metal-dependent hydrolase (beta-lactamase superfamily II)|nr:MBL fold metallo-hydrolase [Odoribacteraceae bacterium]
MEIKIFVFNPIEENTVVLYDETGEAAVVDCGCISERERGALRRFLSENRLTPVVLLNTHLHIDHIFGNAFMLEEYGLSAKAHRADEGWVTDAVACAARMGIRGITPPPPLGDYLDEGEPVRFGHSELLPIHVPGHSAGSLCYYSERDKLLLSGDVLFEGCIGRSDLPGGNMEQLVRGIREKLLVLPGDVRVIPGHGGMTTIERERCANPYLQ